MDFSAGHSADEVGQIKATEQYLTFMLDSEEYGVDILKVQAIQNFGKVTPLPNSMDYVLGVVNLRGNIVPIIELRKRFGMESIPVSSSTVVIMVKIVSAQGNGESKETIIGLLVDAVSEVHNIKTEDLKSAPAMGGRANEEFVKALATIGETMLIILDLDCMIQADHIEQLEQLTSVEDS